MKTADKTSKGEKKAFLLLHNIRSAQNVGAIFRTAEAAGVSKMYLSGYTPAPLDRFGRIRADVAKAALGAEKFLPWESVSSAGAFVKKMRKEGVYAIAVEQGRESVDYRAIRLSFPVLFILGNEVRGIPLSLQSACDAVAEIPLYGKKESLNVSVAAGVALFRILH